MSPNSNKEVLLLEICCKKCDVIFTVCRYCYRGQAYCSEQCREIARLIAHRQAQSRYRTSPKGREANRLAARKRRIKANKKTVADHTTIRLTFRDIIFSKSFFQKSHCSFCGTPGKVVKQFPPRGYGRTAVLNFRDSGKPPPVFEC